MKKIKYILRNTPFFVSIKWLAALLGKSSFPLPFTTTIPAEPFLDRAISRIGHPPDSERSKEQFYSYFSEIWADGYENGLHQQYEAYLPHIPRSKKHFFVDVGCGAGEFLSFLTSNGIQAIGIDENEQEVLRAQKNNINVIRATALEFFSNNPTQFSGVSLIEVIEHIPSEDILNLLKRIYNSLSNDGIILIETINPKNKFAFNAFYTDPTHVRPITKEYLTFLLQWVGFKDAKIIYTGPLAYSLDERNDASRAYLVYAIIARKSCHEY